MKILVRGTNWIGDAVMSIPALRELRRIFPDAHIALHTRSWAEGIFRDADFIDEIIGFDERGTNFKTIIEQARMLRRRRFDLGIILPNSYRSAAIGKLGQIKRRFGFSGEGRRLLLTDPIKTPNWKNARHEIFYYLRLIEEVEKRCIGSQTIAEKKPNNVLSVSDDRKSIAAEQLLAAGIDGSRKIVALGVGSTNSRAKRWGAENYALLCDRLREDLGADVVLLGSRQETDVAWRVAASSKTPPVDLTGKTDLPDVVAILSSVDLFISNDMGLAHISAAVGTNSIVIFGPTNPETTRPFGENAVVIRETVECSPCMLRDCPIDHRCMTRISVDAVFNRAADALLQNPSLE